MEASEEPVAVGSRWYAAAAAAITLIAVRWASSEGLLLLYGDSRSHLTVARRLVDGPNRGMVQLGTVWLPLQHVLLAPFAAFDGLWTSGWAGGLLGAACMAIEVAALWHIATKLNRGARLAGLLAVVLYVTNPSILYLHTSAYTEPVLYASVLVTASGLVHWAAREKPFSGGEMALYCGVPAALAVLSRYDGWAFAAIWALCVAVLTWRRWGSWRYATRVTAAFAAPPVAAALWWMWFNWVNFGDPLEFQRGPYSAQAQQQLLIDQGLLPDRGDLVRSVATFSEAVWIAVGWITLVAAVAGLVVLARRVRAERHTGSPVARMTAIVVVLTAVPALFYVGSLFTGQIALRLGDDGSTFNLRFGAAVIPGLAVLGATALTALGGRVRWRQGAAVALAVVPFVALALVPGWREVGVIRESLEQRGAGEDQWAASTWLADQLDGRRVLIDDSGHAMLPVIGASYDQVVAPFSRDWKAQLRDPDDVTFVVVDRKNPADQVGLAVDDDPDLLAGFELAETFGSFDIYRATDGSNP